MFALKRIAPLCALTLIVGLVELGCQTAYFNAMESLGFEKREILVTRVKNAREAQEEAKEQFRSALEQFSALVAYDGGELEDTYNKLQRELDRSEAKAEAVHKRIEAVDDVAGALFEEWEKELDEYANDRLRADSERKLADTRRRYDQLMTAMRRAEAKIEPVLVPLRDNVLYLKHNLNAQAVASLERELVSVQTDVGSLIAEMEAAIAEADAFIAQMEN